MATWWEAAWRVRRVSWVVFGGLWDEPPATWSNDFHISTPAPVFPKLQSPNHYLRYLCILLRTPLSTQYFSLNKHVYLSVFIHKGNIFSLPYQSTQARFHRSNKQPQHLSVSLTTKVYFSFFFRVGRGLTAALVHVSSPLWDSGWRHSPPLGQAIFPIERKRQMREPQPGSQKNTVYQIYCKWKISTTCPQ